MPLLPLRALPVNDAHDGPMSIRVEMRTSSASIYVRRDADKKIWSCKVGSLQEILAPTQQARALDLIAVVTCLYHGVGHDGPLELTRREVAFTQPETWTDDAYRLTARVSLRTTITAALHSATVPIAQLEAVPLSHPVVDAAAVPIAEAADEDVIFGFNFAPSTAKIDLVPSDYAGLERHSVRLELLGGGFPNSYLNWAVSEDREFVRSVKDGVFTKFAADVEVTLEVVHTKGPALFVLSAGALMVKADHTTTYQTTPGSDLYHSVFHYATVRVGAKGVLQVTVLPGSVSALRGTSLAIREIYKVHEGQ